MNMSSQLSRLSLPAALQESWRRLTGPVRSFPTFLIIGAQKAGTTSLYRYLCQHPLILPSEWKELDYFNRHYERGSSWYRSRFPTFHCLRRASKAYETPGHLAITGEASPNYLYYPTVPERVHQTVPSVKLIVLFRSPVERTVSHYHHSRRTGAETLDLADAIAAERSRLASLSSENLSVRDKDWAFRKFSYVARSMYDVQLRRWLDWFPRAQLLLLRSEDLFADPGAAYFTVTRFLGLPAYDNVRFAVHNHGGPALEIAAPLRASLEEQFAPSVHRLQALVGRTFDW